MRPKVCVLGLCAAAIATAAFAIPPADAAQKKRVVARQDQLVVASRPRARIIVRQRSFLDIGTEVLPGERKFLDYALPPTHTPLEVVQNTGGRVGWHRSPLPGPFFPTRN